MIKILYAVMEDHKKESFEDDLVYARGEYEIMLFETRTWIEVGGEMREYPESTCILYQPGQRVHYRSAGGELVYNWIRFNCDEELYQKGFLPFGVPVSYPDLSWYKIY